MTKEERLQWDIAAMNAQARIEAATAQAALMESLNGLYSQTWQGDSQTFDSIRRSIVEMGKIVQGGIA